MAAKKFMAIIICIFIIAGTAAAIASCADSGSPGSQNSDGEKNGNNNGNDGNESDASASEAIDYSKYDREDTPDNIPQDLKFSGQTFNLLSREESKDGMLFGIEMGVEEENGDIVNDTVYRRNKSVEDRFDITINVIKIPGIWGAEVNFNNTIRNSVKSGDNAYDLIAGYAYFITPLAPEGNFLNWIKVPHIDSSAPWWSADLAEKMTLDGKLYFISGDLSLTFTSQMQCILFNQRMQRDYGLENLYETVLDGKWTFDELYNICKDIYVDVNGDGRRDKEDIYGLATNHGGNICEQLFVSQNQPMTIKGDDGYPYLVFNSPKTAAITENMISLFFENTGVFTLTETPSAANTINNMFENGQALFLTTGVDAAQRFRNMADDFGVLPYPKFDESQEKYMGLTQDAYSLFCIPAICEDFEFAGAVTEALAAESYRKLTPAYYETALKIKYSRDDTTSQMLDIIRSGVQFDFAFVNSNGMENIIHIFRELTSRKSSDFVSLYEKNESVYQANLDRIIEAYKELK